METEAKSRFVKVGSAGAMLEPDATEWVAVFDTQTCLMWAKDPMPRMSFKDALEAPGKLTVGGFTDWRLPTVEELFCLADRTRFNPAIDTDFFPDTPSKWFWSSTVDAASPSAFAWGVDFGYGGSSWYYQSDEGFVRAVRPGQ